LFILSIVLIGYISDKNSNNRNLNKSKVIYISYYQDNSEQNNNLLYSIDIHNNDIIDHKTCSHDSGISFSSSDEITKIRYKINI